MIILETDSLDKSYGLVHAVNHLSLKVESGQVYGILGPNGSGKTTTLSMLMGIIRPDGGTYRWFGDQRGPAANRRIGALIETPNFYPYLSLEQNLKIVCRIKGIDEKDIQRVIKLVGLYERWRSKYQTLSLGMKQRLALGSLLLGDPEVLVLDEVANGLDPEGIAEVRTLIRQVASTGKTIILASHILDEVEKVCTHVVILKKGVKLAEGEVDSLIKGKEIIILTSEDSRQLDLALADSSAVESFTRKGEDFEVILNSGIKPVDLSRELIGKGIVLNRLEVRKNSLEDQFLELVKQDNTPKP
ncbi:MAG: ATP-binding cassette domain-containing protein [Porphyromonadaceae bacterium]|nr:MAG: ATP-binding cassette domain-containing protein [Porphyromonadaceae bacterium]